MDKSGFPLFAWAWPWCDSNGKILNPLDLLKSRTFSYTYLVIIWVIWLIPTLGPAHDCYSTNSAFDCAHGLWPSDLIDAPLQYFMALIPMVLFHNTLIHILFVSTGVMIFVQSFESRESAKETFGLFMACTAIAGVTVSIGMLLSQLIWPDSETLAIGFSRNWIGGSAGFYGVIGASAHHSRIVWFVPLLIFMFELWNHFYNDISIFTASAHMVAMAAGFFLWHQWKKIGSFNSE